MPGIDRHSRVVGWLKVGLPLSALALLSTLFLLADRIDPDAALPYAEVDLDALVNDPRMTSPTYAGTTLDGTSITVSAKSARPATATRTAAAEDVTAQMIMPGGGSTDLTAATAKLDTAAGELRLSGGVRIVSSAGYEITSPEVTTSLDRALTQGSGPVVALGPSGRIEAQSFSLSQPKPGETTGQTAEQTTQAAQSPYLLVFSGGVKLIYQPGG